MAARELSKEEFDQLHRSVKKPKVRESGMRKQSEAETEGMVCDENKGQSQVGMGEKPVEELFQTATGMKLRRRQVSYKDIYLGFNGDGEHRVEDDGLGMDESEDEDWLEDEEEEEVGKPGDFVPDCESIQG